MDRINSTEVLSEKELRSKLHKINLSDEFYDIGGIVLSSDKENAYVDASDSHSIVFGATGSKKTRTLVMPTVNMLKRAGESFVVTDPKGEIYARTASGLKELGYNVIPINFRDFEQGEKWNPLLLPYDYYNNGMKTKALELTGSICEMLFENISLNDPFWSTMAKDVLMGFCILMFEVSDRAECNLKSVIELWNIYCNDKKKFIKMIHEVYRGHMVEVKLECLDNASDKTVGSIEAVLLGGLNKLSLNEEFINFLSQKSVELNDVPYQKTAIYIIIPDENNFYHFAASLFIEQLYEILIRAAQKNPKQRLEIRQNFIIDEFANLPKISSMESMITASRSRNIRFTLIVQSMSQLKDKYKEYEIITSNCNNWIYLYSKEFSLLTQISKLCGDVLFDNGMKIPLFSEFDLQHLDKEKGESLILSGRNLPCVVNLLDIDEYPYDKEHMQYEIKPLEEVRTINERAVLSNEATVYRKIYNIDILDSYSINSKFKSMQDNGDYVWIAIADREMIIHQSVIHENSAAEKMRVLLELKDKYSTLEIKNFEWYVGKRQMKDDYDEILRKHPEEVYVMTYEIEAYSNSMLTKVPNMINEISLFDDELMKGVVASKENWTAKIKLTDKFGGEIEKEIERFSFVPSKSAMEYMCKKATRMVNKMFMNDEYNKARWMVISARSANNLGYQKHYMSSSLVLNFKRELEEKFD